MIGETLSHYKILDKLGAGGMGEVYRAEDTTLDREVALKILPPKLAESQERLDRFQREAKTLAALDHPNIVHIHTVEEVDGVHFLTMQLVKGKPLTQLIPKGGMSLERIFEVAIPLADALATAHEKGVIHRDLKPANIMVTDEGRVKVLDFGLAKLRQEAEAPLATELPTEPLTQEGRVLGTLPFMSPEQLEGKEIDSRSDVFSLGVVLYEMATGERPFKGDTSASLVMAIGRDTPPAVDVLRPGLPHHLGRVVGLCLVKDPEHRYQSVKDVRNELESLYKEIDSGIAAPGRPGEQAANGAHRHRWWLVAAGIAVAVVALGAIWLGRGPRPSDQEAVASADPPSIVVLPFENLGSPEDEYFADGMTEEITGRLAIISGIRVISRTSAMQYKGDRPPLRQIAEELGVDYVLEGSVRWAPSAGGLGRVRITPQLIRVADDSHLWAESYDRVIEDVFEIQSDIASRVVHELDVTLLQEERRELETRPTENLEAYQAYLRGKYLEVTPDFSARHRERVVASYSQAIELDPDFAVAHAALAYAHATYYRLGYDSSDARRTAAREAADRAMALEPESPRVLYGVGFYYYYIEQDYDEALRKFTAAAEMLPYEAHILAATAYIWRRQGRWEMGLERLEKAMEASPRDATIAGHIGEYSMLMRDYPRAVEYSDIAISLAPDEVWGYYVKALTYRLWKGDRVESRRILEVLPADSPEDYFGFLSWFDQYRLDREFDEALLYLAGAPFEWLRFQSELRPVDLLEGEVLRYLGRDELALAAYDAARVSIEKELEEHVDDFRLHGALGLAYAGLGRASEAVIECKRALELMPVSKDAYIGPQLHEDLSRIYTSLGELDDAVGELEYLLSIPSGVSVPLLSLDPRWDPLRDHPRFQALLEKYGQEAE